MRSQTIKAARRIALTAVFVVFTVIGVVNIGTANGQAGDPMVEAADARCYTDWASWTRPDGTRIEGAVDYVERVLGNKIERLKREVRWRGTRINRFRRELRRERAAHRAQVRRLRAIIHQLEGRKTA